MHSIRPVIIGKLRQICETVDNNFCCQSKKKCMSTSATETTQDKVVQLMTANVEYVFTNFL